MTRLFIGMLLLAAAVYAWSYRRGQSWQCPDCFVMPDFLPIPYSSLPAYPPPPAADAWQTLDPQQRVENVRERLLPVLKKELPGLNARPGVPVFIRIFKETRELELWVKRENEWTRFRNYKIAAMSGELGPKLKEGDLQAPEGFYAVQRSALNPRSSYHLSFDIGYPNAYDRHHQRTGTHIMVHGRDRSLGCFAMTDPVAEEIYLLVEAALAQAQSNVPVHVFPFRMTEERLAGAATHPWHDFWQNLREGHDHFEHHREVPEMRVKDGAYEVVREF